MIAAMATRPKHDDQDPADASLDDLERRARSVEANLQAAIERGEVSDEQLDAAQAEAAQSGDAATKQAILSRAASRLIERVERFKDEPDAMSGAVTQRYLRSGQALLGQTDATPLDARLRRRVEQVLGVDPGDVRIHTGEAAQDAASALGAKAFALGDSDIFFGRGEFAPDSPEGFGVLVHEIAHVTDHQVGAAFTTGSSQAAYSQAEGRAEAAESRAVESARNGESGGAATRGKRGKIDMDKLEAAAMKIIARQGKFEGNRDGRH